MKTTSGFTLLEMAIALVVIGLLVSGGIGLMSGVSDTSRYKSTQNNINEIKDALQSYYLLNYRLPCPDTSTPPDGVAEVTCATGASLRGFLPHLTLGIGGAGDAWGEPYKYAVNPLFTATVTASPPAICDNPNPRSVTSGKITINNLESTQTIVDFAAFAVLSTGKNGAQTNTGMLSAFSNSGGCLMMSDSERDNCDDNANANTLLRSGTAMTDANTVIFDDMLVWIADMQLINALRATGVCNETTSLFGPAKKTTTDFTAGATVHNGDYQSGGLLGIGASQTISTSNSNDKVVITGDLERSLDLKDGDNSLLVKGSMNNSSSTNRITGGSGIDIVRIEGNLYEGADLNGGNDQLEVFGNVELDADAIDMGSGDDQVRIYGNVSDTEIKLGSGTNTIYIKGSLDDVKITASSGTGVLYYDSNQKPSSSKLELGSTVTIKCKINNAWTNCP